MRSAAELDVPISQEAKAIRIEIDEEYVAAATDITVVIEVEPEAYAIISDFGAEIEHTDSKTGITRASIKVGYLPTLGRVINQYGGAARVISPESARIVVRNYALTALGQPIDESPSED
jgi:predicted DNA-binding transcriptional regulator YafY